MNEKRPDARWWLQAVGGSMLNPFLFLNTLYLQDVRQLSPLHAGLYTLPMAAMTVLLAPVSGRITGQRGGCTTEL
jgi:hypothetical protein